MPWMQSYIDYRSNETFIFKDKKYLSCKNSDQDGNIIWNCRFCKKENKNSSIYFVSNNFKYCLAKNRNVFL